MSKKQSSDGSQRDRDVTGTTGQTRPKSPAEALEPARAPSRPKRRAGAPEPSRRLSGFARFISGVITIVLAVMIAAAGATLWFTHEFEKPGPLAVSRTLGIPRGEGPIEIAARLEREGIISNRWAFVASHYLRLLTNRNKGLHLKAGEYEFKKGASLAQVHTTIVEGKSILAKITLPEGLTSAQIVEKLNADDSLTGQIKDIPAEGSLLPDTYRFSKGMDRQELINRMRAEQERALAALWEKRQPDLPLNSPAEALVLASIVEKETGRADERDRVAAVFVNRLKKNMRLQSDPTIIYGIVGGKGSLGRPITRADIDGKTAYNTYAINGLPPTPICNPGRPAIEATLNPAQTTDLYFVADGTGGHAFSDTLKEHNAAVANWRKVEKQTREDAKAAEQDTPQAADPAAIPVATPQQTRAVSRPAPAAPGEAATPAAAAAGDKPALPTVTTLNAGATSGKRQGTAAVAATPAAASAAAAAGESAATQPAAATQDMPLPTRKPKR